MAADPSVRAARRAAISILAPALAGLLAAAAVPVPPAARAEDARELIELAPDLRDQFLEEMRADLVNLNDVITAIAEGDFEGAARIAERRMGLGHRRVERMEAGGASDAEIAAAIGEIRAMFEAHGTDLPNTMGRGDIGGMGLGPFMPEALRGLGMAFHQTAYAVADAARAAGSEPNAQNTQALFSALSDMTVSCLGCHEVYRVR